MPRVPLSRREPRLGPAFAGLTVLQRNQQVVIPATARTQAIGAPPTLGSMPSQVLRGRGVHSSHVAWCNPRGLRGLRFKILALSYAFLALDWGVSGHQALDPIHQATVETTTSHGSLILTALGGLAEFGHELDPHPDRRGPVDVLSERLWGVSRPSVGAHS